jgi:hypothetical protein
MEKAATEIMTILSKQGIKLAVESFMWSITFISIQNRPDFIILGPFWYGIQQSI